ncbi:hypothetical protein [Streptomyces sp. NPDC050392]|uniref:hypothetical protein n=1 Tax=Streptomyces sp. NPDC050392 TaxID=3155782 RepID=UPI00341D6261
MTEHNSRVDWTDWQLAREVDHIRRIANYSDDPQAEAERELGAEFTAEQVRRADAYLDAAVFDTGRLEAAESRIGDDADKAWLVQQLTRSWVLLDELQARIDKAGSLMHSTYVSEAIGYVHWTRKTREEQARKAGQ